jgi:hypothetical protein
VLLQNEPDSSEKRNVEASHSQEHALAIGNEEGLLLQDAHGHRRQEERETARQELKEANPRRELQVVFRFEALWL